MSTALRTRLRDMFKMGPRWMLKSVGFWGKLPDVCSILAPMAEVTDAAFRRAVAKYGKPDVLYTEFVSAEGLLSRGRERLLHDLQFHESEHPIVAQIFDNDPEVLARATEFICTLGFDGVEVNMGCPDKAVMKQCAGAALIEDAPRAVKMIQAMKSAAGKIPVSVKTRLGIGRDVLDDWLPRLLEAEPAAITIHARTAKEMSLVPARWERIARAAKLARGSGVRIIGNGDVLSLEDGYAKAKTAGAGGFMVGRVAIGNPFFFSGRTDVTLKALSNETLAIDFAKNFARGDARKSARYTRVSRKLFLASRSRKDSKSGATEFRYLGLREKLDAMCEHARLCEELMPWKPFVHVRKHLSKYASGAHDVKALRADLMSANNAADVANAAERFLANTKRD